MEFYSNLQFNMILSIIGFAFMYSAFLKEDIQDYTFNSINGYGTDQLMILNLLKNINLNDVKIQFWSENLCPHRIGHVKLQSLSQDFEITASTFYGRYAKSIKLKVNMNGEEINVSAFGQDSYQSISDKMRIDEKYNNEILDMINSFSETQESNNEKYALLSQIKNLN